MKKIIFTLLIVLIAQVGTAQDLPTTINQETTYSAAEIEKQPEFPGGMKAFFDYISKSYRMPNVKNLSGRVFVEFTIDLDGSVQDVKTIRDLGYGTGLEAVRVMENCPKWIPGIQNGKVVRVKYSLPIKIDIK